MKICALTMVYRDYWALSQWYAHYSRHLGAEHLFVVAHGPDPEVQQLCPGATVTTIPRDDLSHFDRARSAVLNGMQGELNQRYDWVIRTDADELVCLDPARYDGFAGLFSDQSGDALFALGLNLAETLDDPACDSGRSALAQRSLAMFTPNYSKAWAVRDGIGLHHHGVTVRARWIDRIDLSLPYGVFLVHLKYANTQALSESFARRREIAHGAALGAPGGAWKNPGQDCRRFYQQLDETEEVPWVKAEAQARNLYVRNPVRDHKLGLVRVRRDHPRIRTRLPGWFRDA